MSLPQHAYPGLILGSNTKYHSGAGTHIHGAHIVASLSGRPVVTSSSSPPILSVQRASRPPLTSLAAPSAASASAAQAPSLPSRLVGRSTIPLTVGAIVLARVTRVQPRQASVAIVGVSGAGGVSDVEVNAEACGGVVRREDVRALEADRVVVAEAMRVGDVVRAVVISLGDQAAYYLSTARNELGVLMATSEDGSVMVPISWKEFRDPVTGKTESRKVAKPF